MSMTKEEYLLEVVRQLDVMSRIVDDACCYIDDVDMSEDMVNEMHIAKALIKLYGEFK